MKKSICFISLIFAVVLFNACSKEYSDTISNEAVIELVKKAEAIYQLGNQEIFTITQFEILLTDNFYYDEIANYNITQEIFTKNAIEVLEKSKVLGIPRIHKQGDKVYRASAMSDSATTVFFQNVKSVELVEQKRTSFIYKIVHTPKLSTADVAQDVTSNITIVNQNGKFLIDEFSYYLDDSNKVSN